MSAISERYVNVVFDIPKYSLNVLKITNKENAVSKAPRPSMRKRLFGFNLN